MSEAAGQKKRLHGIRKSFFCFFCSSKGRLKGHLRAQGPIIAAQDFTRPWGGYRSSNTSAHSTARPGSVATGMGPDAAYSARSWYFPLLST